MAGKGGAREGAGRPRKAVKFERPIATAEKRIADRLPWIVDQLFELGAGVLVEEYDKSSGKPVVYQRPPDRAALEYLANRIMGKPTERRELKLDKPLEEMTDDELRAIAES